jgi:hypothetical protein
MFFPPRIGFLAAMRSSRDRLLCITAKPEDSYHHPATFSIAPAFSVTGVVLWPASIAAQTYPFEGHSARYLRRGQAAGTPGRRPLLRLLRLFSGRFSSLPMTLFAMSQRGNLSQEAFFMLVLYSK